MTGRGAAIPVDRLPQPQIFRRVRDPHVEVRPRATDDAHQFVACSHRDLGRDIHRDAVLQGGRNVRNGPQDLGQIALVVLVDRRVVHQQDERASVNGLRRFRREPEAARRDPAGQQLVESRLEQRRLARLEVSDAGRVVVGRDDVITPFGQACRRHDALVPEADHGYLVWILCHGKGIRSRVLTRFLAQHAPHRDADSLVRAVFAMPTELVDLVDRQVDFRLIAQPGAFRALDRDVHVLQSHLLNHDPRDLRNARHRGRAEVENIARPIVVHRHIRERPMPCR